MEPKVVDDPSLRGRRYVFRGRVQAGEALAGMLEPYRSLEPWVLAIPSGGIPVGLAIAERLGAPFDIVVVRKIPVPWNPEAGFGALSWDGEVALNEPLIHYLRLKEDEVEACLSEVRMVLEARLEMLRGRRPQPDLEGRVVIVVDDGLASGFTMLVALKSLRRYRPRKLVAATPTASSAAIRLINPYADRVYCPNIRDEAPFAVADAYQEWFDLTDEEVIMLLKRKGT